MGLGASDQELARRAGTGDDRAFEQLIARHGALIRTACARVQVDPSEREDLYQEALRAIWQGLGSFRGEAKLTTWLYLVAFRAALRCGKRTQANARWAQGAVRVALPGDRDVEPLGVGDWVESWVESWVVTCAAIRDALDRLPPDYLETLRLWVADGLSAPEIAQRLYVSEPTVRSRLSRARRLVRDHLLELERSA